MSPSNPRFLGMDVHTDAIAVAYVPHDHGAEVTSLGSMGTRQCDIAQLRRTMPSKAKHLLFIYEAGPCGYGLSRSLTKQGDACGVVAPSLMLKQPGARVPTDRRDAVQLARLARSGELTAVSVPTVADAAMRDLTRAREDAIRDCKDAQLRLTACVLRHAMRYRGRAHWGGSPPAVALGGGVSYPGAADRFASICPRRHCTPRTPPAARTGTARSCASLAFVPGGRGLASVAWDAIARGAVPLVAELGALMRFESPRDLLTCMGLLPSDYASGAHRRQGALPKAGNIPARHVLVAGA